MVNTIKETLFSLGVCGENTIAPFYPRVRDRDDVAVMRCNRSGVIFLSRTDHIGSSHYTEQESFKYWLAQNREKVLADTREDNARRVNQFKKSIANKKWLDIGTGAGGILDMLSPFALSCAAVEPQKGARDQLIKCGYNVYSDINEAPAGEYDVVTLFHVFEHLTEPIKSLEIISEKMRNSGKLIIEVPHANDFLLSFLALESFKEFTFWSEHLILHTRQSLRSFLEKAGFTEISIYGYQRYPLANHMYWLAEGKPGGHLRWAELSSPELERDYSGMLDKIDKTDTLIAVASK
jgi:2-polyprenyl-3-methyl-5-hydroxy-6-metoxy-1,4-benzoquinol methylase